MLTRREALHVPPALLGGSLLVPALTGCDAIRSLLPDDSPRRQGPTPDLRSDAEPDPAGYATDAIGVGIPFTVRMLREGAQIEPDDDHGGDGNNDDPPDDGVSLESSLVFSPLSALLALTMVGLGAGGATRNQMQQVLGGEMEDLAAFANTVRSTLADVGTQQRENAEKGDPDPDVASLADAVWLQQDLDVGQGYLDDLARYFDAGLFTADFTDASARERAREDMNAYTKEHTDGLIEQIVPEGALDDGTRLVLINALHLKGAWTEPLDDAGTKTFTTASGDEVEVPMLGTVTHGLFEDELCRATQLSTAGHDLSLVLVRPRDDLRTVLAAWQKDDGAALGDLLDGVLDDGARTGKTTVDVSLPAFDLETDVDLVSMLERSGMLLAFEPGAEFPGITTEERLRISDVLQRTVITVDDEGMEAAAATAVIAGTTSADTDPPEPLVLDVPFVFLACEHSMRTPLVVGWVADPSDGDQD